MKSLQKKSNAKYSLSSDGRVEALYAHQPSPLLSSPLPTVLRFWGLTPRALTQDLFIISGQLSSIHSCRSSLHRGYSSTRRLITWAVTSSRGEAKRHDGEEEDEKRTRQGACQSGAGRVRMRQRSEGRRDQRLGNGCRGLSNNGTRWSEMEMKRNVSCRRQLTIDAIIYLPSHPPSCLPGCLERATLHCICRFYTTAKQPTPTPQEIQFNTQPYVPQ